MNTIFNNLVLRWNLFKLSLPLMKRIKIILSLGFWYSKFSKLSGIKVGLFNGVNKLLWLKILKNVGGNISMWLIGMNKLLWIHGMKKLNLILEWLILGGINLINLEWLNMGWIKKNSGLLTMGFIVVCLYIFRYAIFSLFSLNDLVSLNGGVSFPSLFSLNTFNIINIIYKVLWGFVFGFIFSYVRFKYNRLFKGLFNNRISITVITLIVICFVAKLFFGFEFISPVYCEGMDDIKITDGKDNINNKDDDNNYQFSISKSLVKDGYDSVFRILSDSLPKIIGG